MQKQQLAKYKSSKLGVELLLHTTPCISVLQLLLPAAAARKVYEQKAAEFKRKQRWLTKRDWSLLLWEEPCLAAYVIRLGLGTIVLCSAHHPLCNRWHLQPFQVASHLSDAQATLS